MYIFRNYYVVNYKMTQKMMYIFTYIMFRLLSDGWYGPS